MNKLLFIIVILLPLIGKIYSAIITMKKIGIISDTHSTFDDKVRTFLKDCDLILHAGDIGNLGTADAIGSYKELIAVYGNIDDCVVRSLYPEFVSVTIEGVSIFMTHIGGYPRNYPNKVERMICEVKPKLFISGHSHILKVINDVDHNLLHINPGAAGVSGFHRVRTAVRLVIDSGTMKELEVGQWARY